MWSVADGRTRFRFMASLSLVSVVRDDWGGATIEAALLSAWRACVASALRRYDNTLPGESVSISGGRGFRNGGNLLNDRSEITNQFQFARGADLGDAATGGAITGTADKLDSSIVVLHPDAVAARDHGVLAVVKLPWHEDSDVSGRADLTSGRLLDEKTALGIGNEVTKSRGSHELTFVREILPLFRRDLSPVVANERDLDVGGFVVELRDLVGVGDFRERSAGVNGVINGCRPRDNP
jgi:hypothetical protein